MFTFAFEFLHMFNLKPKPMRTSISSVALSLALLSQSAAFCAVASSKRISSLQSTTAVTCEQLNIGGGGLQVNWFGGSGWPVVLTAFDFDGIARPALFMTDAHTILNSGGVGLISPGNATMDEYSDNRRFEFARSRKLNGKSEKLRVDFGANAAIIQLMKATVTVSRFYVDGGKLKERGEWIAYDEGLNVVPAKVAGAEFFYGSQNSGSGPGIHTFTVETNTPFRYLEFIPRQSVHPANNNLVILSPADNSDFNVRKIVIERCRNDEETCTRKELCSKNAWELETQITGIGYNGGIYNSVGSPAGLAFVNNANLGGWGVNSPNPEDNGTFKPEVGFRFIGGVGTSEKLIVLVRQGPSPYQFAKVKLARFYKEFGNIEIGHYQLYDNDLNPIAAVDGGSADFQGVELNNGVNPGNLEFNINSNVPFAAIIFTSKQWIDQATNVLKPTFNGDNSDYHVQCLTLLCDREADVCTENGTGRVDDFDPSTGTWPVGTGFATVTAKNFSGGPVAPNEIEDAVATPSWRANSGGVGVTSTGVPETAALARLELGFRLDVATNTPKTETMRFDFTTYPEPINKITFKMARFYVERGNREQGLWRTFDINGVEILRGAFLATAPLSGPGYFNLTLTSPLGVPIKYIEFTAGPNVDIMTGDPIEPGADNSDYLVREFEIICVPVSPSVNGAGEGFKGTEEANTLSFTDFTIYPNPAVDEINLSMDSEKEGAVSYMVRDLAGKVLRSATWNIEAGSNKTSISVGNLNNGMYLITIKQGEVVKNTKFMIKR